jgi:hypothetical protein
MVMTTGRGARRSISGLLASGLVLSMFGCGTDRPPSSCSWAKPPAAITSDDVVGYYTGSYFGTPMSLTPSSDGTYTAEHVDVPDWLRSLPLPVRSGAWKFNPAVESNGIPFIDIPGIGDHDPNVAIVDGELDAEFQLAGTREQPELYLTVLPYEQVGGRSSWDVATCDNFPRLRQSD